MPPVQDTAHREAARSLRKEAARVHSLVAPERIIFGSGVLACLKHLFLLRRITHFALTSIEYYGPEHFPNRRVDVFDPDDFVEGVVRTRPQVAIVSLAGWAGRRLPLADWFAVVRDRLGARVPLLIADCSHAGAVGFPDLSRLGADLISGDLAKWVAAPRSDKAAFVWPATQTLFDEMSPEFAGYYLSVAGSTAINEGSFVSPGAVLQLAAQYQSTDTTHENLAARFQANLRLARALTGDPSTETCNVCLPDTSPVLRTSALRDTGLTRDLDNGRVRVMCRADYWPPSLASFLS